MDRDFNTKGRAEDAWIHTAMYDEQTVQISAIVWRTIFPRLRQELARVRCKDGR